MKIGIVTGYFDPIHDGHIELLEKSKSQVDKLIVVLNNDLQTSAKKGKPFMEEKVRKRIVGAIKYVDELWVSIDTDGGQWETLIKIREAYPDDELYFVNGGDRDITNVPEFKIKDQINLKFMDNVGEKINSSRKYYSK
jgi:cytidyltransferase-like protein